VNFQAVIFDLFGTLVNDFGSSVGRMQTEMAAALGVAYEPFSALWNQTLDRRLTGDLETLKGSIAHVCAAMSAHVNSQQIAEAVEIRLKYTNRALEPKPDALSTLAQLKTDGFRIGLISNASIEIPMLWAGTAFADFIDEPIFSSSVGMKKPDICIYQLACERLSVSPESCLYVGDGEDHELKGAAKVGLHPVLIRPSSENKSGLHQEATEWQGATITRLPEVLQLVGH
jgi:putative hydrolase of the HAD superfamily